MTILKQAGVLAARTTSDVVLGAVGGSLAVASACFGLYMNVHGPATPPGTGKDFSVFAQLAPRGRETAAPRKARHFDDLDTTATATIAPRRTDESAPPPANAEPTAALSQGVVLTAANAQAAEITMDGHVRTVRVGDFIPGAGEILQIIPGDHPRLKTSRGMIVSSNGE